MQSIGNTGGGMAGDLMKSMSNWLLYGGAPDDFGYNNTDISMYPSSNDTHLMVTKPMLVNLGSKSSKCTEIKTPMDPAKMRFIDNKRMSIIIGCTAGILVFIFIIIRYVICILAWNISKNTAHTHTMAKGPSNKNFCHSTSFSIQ